MKTLKITCAEKGVLINKAFNFDFPVEYEEYEQLSQQDFYTQVHDKDVIKKND